MEVTPITGFKHTTLAVYPETHLGNGKWTPKRVGITLLDEEPGFTGVYVRDSNGGLFPARTISHTPKGHHAKCCKAWLAGTGINLDLRTVKMNTLTVKNALKKAFSRDFQVKGERHKKLWHFNVVLPWGEIDPKAVKQIVLNCGAITCDVMFENKKVA